MVKYREWHHKGLWHLGTTTPNFSSKLIDNMLVTFCSFVKKKSQEQLLEGRVYFTYRVIKKMHHGRMHGMAAEIGC